MKTHTRVAVIGGGIAGCSTLYHLTQEGITDCVLIERDELTSGTTWHSAAQVTNFGGVQTMVGLKTHSINLYKELGRRSRISDQLSPCDWWPEACVNPGSHGWLRAFPVDGQGHGGRV